MSGIISLDFQVFFYMTVGLFGLVGFLRGWWKEAITTGLLVFLLLILQYPEIAVVIIDQINNVVQLITVFFTAGSLNASEIASAAGSAQPPVIIDPTTKQLYIGVLVVLIVASYFIGKMGIGENEASYGGRLFGGILGFANGLIALSLVREYILGRYLPGYVGSASAAAVPEQITVTITNVPQNGITDGATLWLVILGGFVVLLIALGTRYRVEMGSYVPKTRTPPGYKT